MSGMSRFFVKKKYKEDTGPPKYASSPGPTKAHPHETIVTDGQYFNHIEENKQSSIDTDKDDTEQPYTSVASEEHARYVRPPTLPKPKLTGVRSDSVAQAVKQKKTHHQLMNSDMQVSDDGSGVDDGSVYEELKTVTGDTRSEAEYQLMSTPKGINFGGEERPSKSPDIALDKDNGGGGVPLQLRKKETKRLVDEDEHIYISVGGEYQEINDHFGDPSTRRESISHEGNIYGQSESSEDKGNKDISCESVTLDFSNSTCGAVTVPFQRSIHAQRVVINNFECTCHDYHTQHHPSNESDNCEDKDNGNMEIGGSRTTVSNGAGVGAGARVEGAVPFQGAIHTEHLVINNFTCKCRQAALKQN